VAQLRALAKTNPNAPIPAMSANSASQKAAALAAAALLQKKFGQTSGPGNADHAIRKRRSPSPDRFSSSKQLSCSRRATFQNHAALRVMSVYANSVVPALLVHIKSDCVNRMFHHGQ